MEFLFRPIGIVHSPYKEKTDAPIQAPFSEESGTIEVFPEYGDGLMHIEGFSHLWVMYYFHKSQGYELHVLPYLGDQERGVFACRAPRRPNPIGMSLVELEGREGNMLNVKGLDILDGAPVLDIKPFVRDFDQPPEARKGWLEDHIRHAKDAKGW